MSDEIRRIAAAYPPEAAMTPKWERERHFTPDQQAAWQHRFERSSVSVAGAAHHQANQTETRNGNHC